MERAMRPGFVLGELVAGEQHGGTAPVFHGKAEEELGLGHSVFRFGSGWFFGLGKIRFPDI